ncbi:MAG: glycosyltransferase family 39 protein [Chloroflexota bacterium]|jgi:4-amino-4-deoxy-L-arabinose transferase-like glycosyltransferase
MLSQSKIKQSIQQIPFFFEGLTLLAVMIFLGQAFYYAHTSPVSMDEGTYLMKGLLYLRGDYYPFQDYGPWVNKMPFSFLIPGIAQIVFGPGLRTGRYFSIFLSLLTMLFLYITIHQLVGKKWATLALWVMAISPMWISFYVHATTQPIVACMLMAAVYLILGDKKPLWQVVLSGILTAMVVLTRQNMAPVVLFTPIFAFWQHGKRAGWFASIALVLTLFIVHVIYYPKIFSIWADMIPFSIPLLDQFSPQLGIILSKPPIQHSNSLRFTIFLEGFRFYFLPLVGLVFTWLLWKDEDRSHGMILRRAVVSLSLLVISLWGVHIYGALGNDYCPFCYSGYISFFAPVVLLLVLISMDGWRKKPGQASSVVVVMLVLFFSIAIGYSVRLSLRWLLDLPVPRISNGQILPGASQLWGILSFGSGASYTLLKDLIPTLMCLLVGLLTVISGFVIVRFNKSKTSGAYTTAIIFLILGAILLPMEFFGKGNYSLNCPADVIARTEEVGAQIVTVVKPNSLVYWENDLSPLPLLYLNNVRIFPPQLNHGYSFFLQGDPDILAKNGFWSNELAQRWIEQADYALLAEPYTRKWLKSPIFLSRYDEVNFTSQTDPCDKKNGSPIHIFRRKD